MEDEIAVQSASLGYRSERSMHEFEMIMVYGDKTQQNNKQTGKKRTPKHTELLTHIRNQHE